MNNEMSKVMFTLHGFGIVEYVHVNIYIYVHTYIYNTTYDLINDEHSDTKNSKQHESFFSKQSHIQNTPETHSMDMSCSISGTCSGCSKHIMQWKRLTYTHTYIYICIYIYVFR